jgi:hypothetical protein
VFDEIPHLEIVLKRHQNSDDPFIMAWDHYIALRPVAETVEACKPYG